MTKQKIAYIGTGAMGKQMIFQLLNEGYEVNVYDKYPEAADSVIAAGAVWKDSPRAAAQESDLVITNLPLPHHVLENMLGEATVENPSPSPEVAALAGMRPGSTWLDFSTTDYHNTQHIAKVAAKQGIYSLESPVSNLSHMGVDFCNVSFYVSGDKAGYDLCEAALASMGKISFFVGDHIGKAQTIKLLTNLLFYGPMLILGEVLTISKLSGIPLLWMWDFIRASQGSSFVAEQVTPFMLDGSYDYSCSLEITVKDTDLTVQLADELGVAMPLGRIVEKRYREAGQKYRPHDNHGKVNHLIEEDNHLALSVEDFVAPSPYGLNRDYIHSTEKVVDTWGRVKPRPYQLAYEPPAALADGELMRLAQTLTDFMAYTNFLILQEANQLGRAMGLTDELLVNVIRWSCGTNWVFDNIAAYRPDPTVVERLRAFELGDKMKLPVITQILAYDA